MSPGAAVVGATAIATLISAGFAVGVNESTFDVLLVASDSVVPVVTVAVLSIAVVSEALALIVATNETVWVPAAATSGTVHVTSWSTAVHEADDLKVSEAPSVSWACTVVAVLGPALLTTRL